MRNLLEIMLLGLAASASFLTFYWTWQEFARWWSERPERRARSRAARSQPPE